ncbi:50S ribosomal protein L11 methyltransferase [Brumicola pallidula]|jgi:ribosomal protein L11 methyltransferase|uniref:Ribosomal protein L11 methyltransferase n=1 Tax=Brumicola pallidula DSM 14239 = ACAM 615 TaxID=1121922 RepID=K6YUE6_9ALTE|nr:50S ribosomal protein L11 methyltransferase [Glaciecola pallidula]GAC27621.1 ribosomal protein L11 methyltransferase [Glaciecola pallidula DSM 14239 = ACAM 615]
MAWQQLKINVKAEHAEAVGDMLTANKAQAVTFVDAKDTPMYEPKPGEVLLWPDTQVVGLFNASDDLSLVIKRLQKARVLGKDFVYVVDQLEDKDWEREWMVNFHPMQFGKRLWICPSWLDAPDSTAVNILLDPGLAFGTGTHPTTSLCLQWLDQADVKDKTVVDFGCGSGILAIAALKLDAEKVIGIDIDPQALQATMDNASRNKVESRLSVFLPADQPELKADIVMANILAAPLKELSAVISNYCAKNGQLIMSGILIEQAEDVKSHYENQFTFQPTEIQGEWVRLSAQKTS